MLPVLQFSVIFRCMYNYLISVQITPFCCSGSTLRVLWLLVLMEKNRGERNESALGAGLLCRTESWFLSSNTEFPLSPLCTTTWHGHARMREAGMSYASQKVCVWVFYMQPSEGFLGSGENCVMVASVFLSGGSTGICFCSYTIKLTDHLSQRLSRKHRPVGCFWMSP